MQKARLARIQIAKATSGAAFVSKKKAAEAKMAARAAGLDVDDFPHFNNFSHKFAINPAEKLNPFSTLFAMSCDFSA